MKRIAVLMNTDEVGGAERSLAFQMMNQDEVNITFFIPRINNSVNLEMFLRQKGFESICYYDYPRSIYALSRSHFRFGFTLLKDFFRMIFAPNELSSLGDFEVVYINGNKAALMFFAKNRMINFRGKVVWHLRDYYHSSLWTNKIWNFLDNVAKNQLEFICNSTSVKISLQNSPWKNHQVKVIYNPVGEQVPLRDTAKRIKTIGFVSMMAPWKGVHEIVLWCKLFENELKELGIEAVKIYGADIYKTNGAHSHYVRQLKKLNQKFDSSLLSFEGHKSPEEIFNEIDCLIHYSLRPEPFGRVILEAFEAGVPVVSTCLGGAAELVEGHVTGLKVFPYDRRGLYYAIEQLVENKVKTFKLIAKGIERSGSIQKNIHDSIAQVLETEEAS